MSDKPNILLFFTDQQRADTISALGNQIIKIPNLDRLCREGVSFTNAFSPSPVCVSARCSMHYGQYPGKTGCYENCCSMPEDRKSFMGILTDNGYRTHGVGKCHFTPESNALRGFQTRETQEEIVGGPSFDDYLKYLFDNGYDYVNDPFGSRGEMYYIPQPSQLPEKFHPSQWIADRSIDFIDKQDSQQPWFMFSSFVHPHPPFSVPAPWNKLYRAAQMPYPKVPQNSDKLLTYINRFQNRYKYRDQGIDNNLLRCMKAYYYACISFVDYQIGKILDALEKSGQMDNTLILFSSDHGEFLGDYNCFGKRSMHNPASNVPLIARMPGRFMQGQICDEVTSLVDIAPTILSAAGIDGDFNFDGIDLADVATGDSDREYVFSEIGHEDNATYMAVSKLYKYFYSSADDRECLFDRKLDSAETRDCIGNTFYNDTALEIKSVLVDHLKAGIRQAAIEGDDFKKFPPKSMPDNPDALLLIQDHQWADDRIPGYKE